MINFNKIFCIICFICSVFISCNNESKIRDEKDNTYEANESKTNKESKKLEKIEIPTHGIVIFQGAPLYKISEQSAQSGIQAKPDWVGLLDYGTIVAFESPETVQATIRNTVVSLKKIRINEESFFIESNYVTSNQGYIVVITNDNAELLYQNDEKIKLNRMECIVVQERKSKGFVDVDYVNPITGLLLENAQIDSSNISFNEDDVSIGLLVTKALTIRDEEIQTVMLEDIIEFYPENIFVNDINTMLGNSLQEYVEQDIETELFNFYFIVKSDNAKIYQEPSFKSSVKTIQEKGSWLRVQKRTLNKDIRNNVEFRWYYIAGLEGDFYGWVFGEDLDGAN